MPGRNKVIYLLDAPAAPVDKNLFGLSREQLRAVVVDLGQPVYRADQLLTAMFRQRIESLDAVSVLPRALREEMVKAGWGIAIPKILESFRSVDGTERYLVGGEDGQTVETVWMPDGDGGEQGDGTADDFDGANTKRATICVSSQVGCAVNCRFCLTAQLGLQRNLKA
jgi:23S rRNA (adenine2503-C2)-methyltransferase